MLDSLLVELRERAKDAARATDMAAQFAQPVPPPLDEPSVRNVEAALGYALPRLLRKVYLLVANGGIGPGYGLLPLLPNRSSSEGESILTLYQGLSSTDPSDPAWSWPRSFLPFCEWGCAIRSCVDCASPEGTVLTFDPGSYDLGRNMSDAFAPTHSSLRSWFADWLSGTEIWGLMFEPDPARAQTGINPFTRQPMTLVPNRLRRR